MRSTPLGFTAEQVAPFAAGTLYAAGSHKWVRRTRRLVLELPAEELKSVAGDPVAVAALEEDAVLAAFRVLGEAAPDVELGVGPLGASITGLSFCWKGQQRRQWWRVLRKRALAEGRA